MAELLRRSKPMRRVGLTDRNAGEARPNPSPDGPLRHWRREATTPPRMRVGERDIAGLKQRLYCE